MKKTIKTLIRYIGGKRRMVKKIERSIPASCSTLVEPFAGSAVISINCTGFEKTVLNDVDCFIVNLLRTVSDKDKGSELLKILESTSFTKTAFLQALNRREAHGELFIDNVHLAAESWFLSNYSFNARGKTFSERTETWRHNKLIELDEIINDLSSRDVQIHCSDGLWFLQENGFLNDSSCLIYLDPPYIAGARSPAKLYRRDMPERENHILLLKAIYNAKAKVAISGYDSKVYNEYLLGQGWHKYSLGEYSKSCDTSAGKSKGNEIIWTNYDIAKEAPKALEQITECR